MNIIYNKTQIDLINRIKDAEFDLSYKNTSKKLGMPLASVFKAWQEICANNNVQIAIILNDNVIAQMRIVKEKKVKEISLEQQERMEIRREELEQLAKEEQNEFYKGN